jgi:hypothetical protein
MRKMRKSSVKPRGCALKEVVSFLPALSSDFLGRVAKLLFYIYLP